MLSIGVLGAEHEHYYLAAVAQGAEDYYSGQGEAPGRWLGRGAARLGLTGPVREEAFLRLFAARDPESGAPLLEHLRRGRRPGFDLTFSAPKSVSLLHALGKPEVARVVVAAHAEAVEAALGYLEREAARVRRGRDGARELPAEGLVAAAFTHRTSRAGDPALHTHVIAFNLARGPDGRLSALHGARLYRHAQTAGYLYQAHLRHALTQGLGLEWGPTHKGMAEMAGVPREVLRAFSRRRVEIERRLEAGGGRGRRAGALAALLTRKAKDYGVRTDSLVPGWRERARALAFGAEQITALLGCVPEAQELRLDAVGAAELVGPAGLTQRAATFVRRDVLRALAERAAHGAPVARLEAQADALLRSGEVVPLARAWPAVDAHGQESVRAEVSRAPGERRYSTPEMLLIEQGLVEGALRRQHAGVAQATPQATRAALEGRPALSAEQRRMVERLVSGGRGVEVVVGRAGAGKTYALEAARAAWEASGLHVMGTALAARAAAELEGSAGIESHSVAALLRDLARPEVDLLGPCSVLVVDEAGMVGTRLLARLAAHSERAGAKLVLVGDPAQLPEIEAGGALRALAGRLGAISLSENRRQRAAWERQALELLRQGAVGAALDRYAEHGRVRSAPSASEVRLRLVDDWWAHGARGVIIAARRTDVAELNALARGRMADVGALGRARLEVAGREFATGDRVLCLRNDRRLGVLNGRAGVVSGLDTQRGAVRVRLAGGAREREVILPARYLRAGHLDHGYALTAHKAQGLTASAAFVLGDEAAYREWAYVALSRGVEENHLYVLAPEERPAAREELGAPAREVPDALTAMRSALGRSRAKALALEHGVAARDGRGPGAAGTPGRSESLGGDRPEERDAQAALSGLTLERLRAEWGALHERVGRHAGTEERDITELERRLEGLVESADTLRGLRQRAEAARAALGPVGRRRRRADAQALATQAREYGSGEARLRAAAERLGEEIAHRPDCQDWEGEAARRRLLEAELSRRAGVRAASLALDTPPYLSARIGRRPDGPAARSAWLEAVRAVEGYRARFGIKDHRDPLGAEPAEAGRRERWRSAAEALSRAEATLRAGPETGVSRPEPAAQGHEPSLEPHADSGPAVNDPGVRPRLGLGDH